ncbi:hypothetical protein IT409_02830 [Candidatus Falkowbacteria bacterium]|nr:hypothetical protein [Candidatus Falkowbacteria bacterium]
MVINEVNARGMNPRAPLQVFLGILNFVVNYVVLHASRAWKFLSENLYTFVCEYWEWKFRKQKEFFEKYPQYLEGEKNKSFAEKIAGFILWIFTPITFILRILWTIISKTWNAIFGGGGHGHGH